MREDGHNMSTTIPTTEYNVYLLLMNIPTNLNLVNALHLLIEFGFIRKINFDENI